MALSAQAKYRIGRNKRFRHLRFKWKTSRAHVLAFLEASESQDTFGEVFFPTVML